ncbi:hypothetical protein O181_031669 [Austropuccinia psidii MF-1]|uniref:Chromo domain-containing protein n=1 Tax=Austropuccinia psidii MF-1 TaxID=1389203 RepID=A0A9Q3CVC0_9BASI|nr:hypothetical protein [Austropuccinia psidii MF-1]
MDSLTQLPFSNNFDSILVVVDRFSKMKIFTSACSTVTALDLALIFISNFVSKNGLPVGIVSDRGVLFVSSFWTQLCQQLKISRDISTAFQPVTDGQTERVNQILEQYLQMYQVVKEEFESAIRQFKRNADRKRKIKPGEKLWLASKNIKTTQPTKKLIERWLGPFEVLKKIGSHSYHLKLPQQWKAVHPVFHVSLSEPVKQSIIPNQNQFPPQVSVEEQEEWKVAQVLDSKLKRGKLLYLVEWKEFGEDQEGRTWEAASNLTKLPDLVKDSHTLYPDKPGSNTSRV